MEALSNHNATSRKAIAPFNPARDKLLVTPLFHRFKIKNLQ